MMWRALLGVAAAFASSSMSSLGVSLQALEAAASRRELALRASLLAALARRRRWLAGAATNLAAWPLQALALILAPLTLVRPSLAAGLVVLVAINSRRRGTGIDRAERIGLAAIVAGVGVLAVTAPARTALHAPPSRLAVTMGALALLTLAPYPLRALGRPHGAVLVASAGLGAACSGLATKLAADDLMLGEWPGMTLWLGVGALVATVGLLSEMTALQGRPPTQVVPAIFILQMIVPVALAPFLAGEDCASTPAGGLPLVLAIALVTGGVVTLARRPAIAGAAVGAAPRSALGEEAPIQEPPEDATGV